MKEMVGGCCVCSDDRGWTENPLVYCDGPGCTVAVHQACYGIVTVPLGNWYCRKCESADVNTKVRCELCPNKDGALKPTDNNAWAHVVCALYIPEVRFGNVSTMEPIILEQIPPERYHKTCYLCEERDGRGSARSTVGACMSCNKAGCKAQFHVTCAQSKGLLCEEAGNYMDNVKYCGYCHHHYNKIVNKQKKGVNVKVIPPYKPVTAGSASPESESMKSTSKRKLSETRTPPTTGPTPDGSPRPITPSGASTSGQHVPTPSNSPSLGAGGQVQNPGPSSSASSPSEAKRPLIQGTTTLPQVDLTAGLLSGGTSQSSGAPLKRSRSQSSEKTDKPRRSSKRSGTGNSSGNKPLTGSPTLPTASVPNSNKTDGAGSSHLANHLGGESSHSGSGKARRHSQSHAPNHSAHVLHATSHSPAPATNHISHTSTNHLSHQQPGGSASTTPAGAPPMNHIHVVPSPSPPQVKDEKTDIKLLPNVETVQAPHMLGNRLNPSSTMAQKMCDTLSQEMVAHSVFTTDSLASNHLGPQIPGRSSTSSSVTTLNHTPTAGGGGGGGGGGVWGGSSTVPQSLEQLLERQWEQGSQFLMEQAQHFDIASLLTCLHQLRAENTTLEEQVNQLMQRRDHLLAVNARLAIPLVPPATAASSAANPPNGNPITAQQVSSQPSGPIVENGLPASSPQDVAAFRSSAIRQNSSNPSNASGINNPSSAQNSVLVRTSAADSRRSSHSPATSVYNTNPLFQQNQQQVVMRRDVIEMNQSGSSKAS